MRDRVKQASQSVWGASPAGTTFADGMVPGTQEFFETVIAKRSRYEFGWLPQLIPFPDASGKSVLEIGCGAGYDAYTFCKHNTNYSGIDITYQNLPRTRAHLAYYNYHPELIAGDAENLMFRNGSFDWVFSNGVLHHTPDLMAALIEIERVLNQGGLLWLIVYHRNSVFFWLTVVLYHYLLRGGFLKRSFKDQLSLIEYTESGALPLVNVYSKREIKGILDRTGLSVENIWIRKLVADEFPPVPVLRHLWSCIPEAWYDWLSQYLGWYIIVKARK